MNNKNIIILLLLIFSASIIVIQLSNNSDEQLVDKEIPNQKLEDIEKKSVGLNKIEIKNNKVEEKIKPINYENAHINQFIAAKSVCGFDYEENQINKNIKKNVLSELQIKAKNIVTEECGNWYDYLNSLSETEYSDAIEKIKNEKILTLLFFNSESFDNEMFQKAYGVINDGSGSSGTITVALAKLLTEDFNLMQTIANKLGTKDLGYFINNHSNIAMLYSDSVFPSESTSNSLAGLNACALNENMCGLSASQYIANSMTPNQYMDLVNVVDILNQLVSDGYFDQYLE